MRFGIIILIYFVSCLRDVFLNRSRRRGFKIEWSLFNILKLIWIQCLCFYVDAWRRLDMFHNQIFKEEAIELLVHVFNKLMVLRHSYNDTFHLCVHNEITPINATQLHNALALSIIIVKSFQLKLSVFHLQEARFSIAFSNLFVS